MNLNPLREILKGNYSPQAGVQIKSEHEIKTTVTLDRGSQDILVTFQNPKPTVLVTKFFRFSAILDYIKINEKQIKIKANGWPELTLNTNEVLKQ
jgi:hypothetical protein